MKKIILLFVLFLFLFINARNLISYVNEDYHVKIYYPEDYKQIVNKNGVIFFNKENGGTFSLLYSESKLSAKEHLQRLEDKLMVVNILDSAEIIMSDEEKEKFNIDDGYKSFFTYWSGLIKISKSIIAMKKDSIVYLVITEFTGDIDTQEIHIIDDCISMFKVLDNNE